MGKTIYIGAKVTGEDYDACYRKFEATEELLVGLGYNVINPMKIVAKDTRWHVAMDMLKPELLKADILFVLKDWKQSEGTKIEVTLAEKHNIKIVFYNQMKDMLCSSY